MKYYNNCGRVSFLFSLFARYHFILSSLLQQRNNSNTMFFSRNEHQVLKEELRVFKKYVKNEKTYPNTIKYIITFMAKRKSKKNKNCRDVVFSSESFFCPVQCLDPCEILKSRIFFS